MDFSSRLLAAAAQQQFPFGVRASLNPPVPQQTKNIAVLGDTVVVTTAAQATVSGLAYSLDAGQTWATKAVYNPITGAEVRLNALVANPETNEFLAGTTDSLGVQGLLFRSPNGIDWAPVTQAVFSGNINAIFYFADGAYKYVLTTDVSPGVYTSNDGVTWTAQTSPGFINVTGIAFGNNAYILVSNDDSVGTGGVRRTLDFSTYTTPTFTQVVPAVNTLDTSSVVFLNDTFVISATHSTGFDPLSAFATGFVYKSTDDGLTFSMSTPSEGFLDNVPYGLLVNGPDNYSQSRPSASTNYAGETTYAYPNRGAALGFATPLYTLETRSNNRITTTTTTPSVFGLSAINRFPLTPTTIKGPGGYTISRVELYQVSGTFRIVTYNHDNPSGRSVNVTNTLMNVNVRNTLTASNPAQGYAFALGTNTYIFFFASTEVAGTHYFSSTAYSTTTGATFTQFLSLPAEFNVSGPTAASGADYNLTVLRGDIINSSVIYAINYGPPSAVNLRYMTSASGVGGWSVLSSRVANSQYISYSAAAPATYTAFLSNGFSASLPAPNQYKALVCQIFTGFVVTSTVTITGLDGTVCQFEDCTDMAYINGQFRLFCKFKNLLGEDVGGVISVTDAGVVTHTVLSNFSRMKVLGISNSTIFVLSMDTGALYTSTDGVAYTLRTSWNQPALCQDVLSTATGGAYTSGRFLTPALTRSTNTSNWFTTTDGSGWARTAVVLPTADALLLRQAYPSKYVDTTAGRKVAVYTGPTSSFDASDPSGNVGVAAVGNSLGSLPYKNISPNNPNATFSTVYYNSAFSVYIAPSFDATAVSMDGVVWDIEQTPFNPNTSVLNAVGITRAIPIGSKVIYRLSNTGLAYTADQADPTSLTVISLPTIGTDYTASQVATDGVTVMLSVYSTFGGTARRNYTSTDGATWTAVANTPAVTLNLRQLAADPGQTAAGIGKFAMQGGSTVYVTADGGVTWSTGTLPSLPGFDLDVTAVTFADGMWVATGYVVITNGPPRQFRILVYSSADNGASWVKQYETSNITGFSNPTAAPTGNARQFVVSFTAGSTATILLSNSAGGSYAITTGTYYRSIVYGGPASVPALLAIRSDYVVEASNDGVTWTRYSELPVRSSTVLVRDVQNQKWFGVTPGSSLNVTGSTFIYSV